VGAGRIVAASIVRRRWRSAIVVMLLVGVSGAIVFAALAVARRSASALTRFNAYSRPSDLEISAGSPTAAQLDVFAHAAGVAGVGLINAYDMNVDGLPNLKIAASVDGSLGSVVDRARLVRGRRPNPNAADEIDVGEGLAAQRHVTVGSVLSSVSVTPGQLQLLFQGKNPGTPAGPHVRLHIVGIVRRPLDLGDLAASGGVVVLTPAFNRAYVNRIG
jgi:hypothetical protein